MRQVVIVGLLAAGHRGIAEADERSRQTRRPSRTSGHTSLRRRRSHGSRRWQDATRSSRGDVILAREQHEIVLEQRRGFDKPPVFAGANGRQFASSGASAGATTILKVARAAAVGPQIKNVAVIHRLIAKSWPARRDQARRARPDASRSTTWASEASWPCTRMKARRPSRVDCRRR